MGVVKPSDGRCPNCDRWPEMIRGAWWPHAPGAPCNDSNPLVGWLD